jgi:hypothetical protein
VLDADGPVDEHEERVARLALEHQELACRERGLRGQDCHRLQAALVEIGEERYVLEQRDPVVHAGSIATGSGATACDPSGPMSALTRPIRSTLSALRQALSSEGIRRLEASWALGVAADTGLLVVLLVVIYLRDGVVAAGILGAIRMVPAVVSAMLSGAILERFRGERVLLAIALIRAATAGMCAYVIASNIGGWPIYALAAIAAAAGAPVRPTQATLMPAVARSASELVAANMAWSTGEGLASMVGPPSAGRCSACSRRSRRERSWRRSPSLPPSSCSAWAKRVSAS